MGFRYFYVIQLSHGQRVTETPFCSDHQSIGLMPVLLAPRLSVDKNRADAAIETVHCFRACPALQLSKVGQLLPLYKNSLSDAMVDFVSVALLVDERGEIPHGIHHH